MSSAAPPCRGEPPLFARGPQTLSFPPLCRAAVCSSPIDEPAAEQRHRPGAGLGDATPSPSRANKNLRWIHGYEVQLWPSLAISSSPLAAAAILACTAVLLMGASESARINLAITALNMALIGFIVVMG